MTDPVLIESALHPLEIRRTNDSPLNIVIEHPVLIPVLLQESEGSFRVEIFMLNEDTGIGSGSGSHERIHEAGSLFEGNSGTSVTEVEGVSSEGLVVGSHAVAISSEQL